ncbi:MAG: oligosaccharide flippase family protein [Saprospiraceae bacterium]|nr:oligosaccharide flippase family protein [Saprospiraceae bacterium]
MTYAEHIEASTFALNRVFRWQLLSSAYLTALQLAGYFLIGRFLGYKEMGVYAIFQVVFRMAVSLFEPGMFVSLIQKHSYSEALMRQLQRRQTLLALGVAAGWMAFFAVEREYLTAHFPVVAMSMVLLLLIARGSRDAALLTRALRQRELGIAQMTGASFEFALLVSLIWHFDPLLVFPAAFLVRFAVFYFLCAYFVRKQGVQDSPGEPLEEHLSFARYQVSNQGISFVQGNFDTVLVASVFGLAALGPYNYASELSYLLFSKINPIFNKAVFPVLSRYRYDGAARSHIVGEALLSHAIVCLGLYALLYANLDFVVAMIFRDPGGYILEFSRYICIMAMIRSVNNLLFSKLLALGESRKLLQWNIAVLIFNYAFIAVIYFTGSPMTTFLWLNCWVSLVVLLYTAYKLSAHLDHAAAVWKPLLRFLAVSCAGGAALWGLNCVAMPAVVTLILGGLVLLGLYTLFFRSKMMRLIRMQIV